MKIGVLLLSFAALFANAQECIHREFGFDGTVCVCNEDHCDVIPPLDENLPSGQYQVYTTTQSGKRYESTIGTFTTAKTDNEHNRAVIEPEIRYQTIFGFGGAFTDSAGININSLSAGAKERLMKAYFSKEGIEYSLCRVPIGGTDFSTHGYSYDDGEEDPELLNFRLAREDYLFKIPLIKEAYALTNNNLKLFSSAWTAPKWMKTNKEYNGVGNLEESMYQPWANYFLKFLDSYKEEGIDFWGITTGNEPINGLIGLTEINSVGWPHQAITKWVAENLGPTLRNSQHSDIKIIALDDQRFFLPKYADLIFVNPATRHFVDGLAVHWYWDYLFPSSFLQETHDKHPDKFLLATEACLGDKPWDKNKVELGSWSRGEAYAQDIIEDLKVWVTGWVDWNLALDTQGGPTYIDNFVDSPIIVNTTSGEFYKQPMFYVMGHFSKFIPPGSVRINVGTDTTGLDVVAFERLDGGISIVVNNRLDESFNLPIMDQERGVIEAVIEPRSISTFIYW